MDLKGNKSSGERFLEEFGKGNFLGTRHQVEALVRETALAASTGESPRILWGMASDMPDRSIRCAIGILLELLRLRTRRWPTIGAIRQLEGLFAEEIRTGKKLFADNERSCAEKLLVGYILRHPRDADGSVLALTTLAEYLDPRPIYRRAMATLARRKVFAPPVRERFSELELAPPRIFSRRKNNL
ncbi:MAG: hypothetical protein DRP16_06015 [Candidatus Aenigmatarchaeota archaeon]|nr:MAG: hypothetical protein DRP16_06015 [Candidatus Aenigmarchaeota archaeon]